MVRYHQIVNVVDVKSTVDQENMEISLKGPNVPLNRSRLVHQVERTYSAMVESFSFLAVHGNSKAEECKPEAYLPSQGGLNVSNFYG